MQHAQHPHNFNDNVLMTHSHDTQIIQNANKMSSQSQYLKRLHEAALQGVVDDLVKEKENG